jgi:hypothetical protein
MSMLALQAPPTGDSFLRGFNRIEGFLLWQLAAFGAAVVGAIILRLLLDPAPRMLRVIGYGPVVLSLLLAIALVAVVAWAAFSPPPVPPAEAMPQTTVPVS